MLQRDAKTVLPSLAKGFPIVVLTGPRQSGKTTLARDYFKDFEYLSMEDLDVREEATEDPRGFLSRRQEGFILDEVQHTPELFSYLQTYVDASKQMGKVVLTGSQNFQLMEKISQSLAGRAGLLELLPFSWSEFQNNQQKLDNLDETLFTGGYPPIHDRKLDPVLWLPRYIQTYIDRDVRSIRQITNLNTFQKFVRLCAGRIGQLLNYSSLANECGVDVKTAQQWISILEASYIIFRLQPHHKNFNKRLVKQPKLYFVDTGLACSLLGIEAAQQLETHYIRGSLFENAIICECLKARYNAAKTSNLYFWRDHLGREIDLIQEIAGKLHPIEINSSETVHSSFFENLSWFMKTAGSEICSPSLIYGGTRKTIRKEVEVVPWNDYLQSIL